jgi:orotidine-5'-phosphate decarboxylase
MADSATDKLIVALDVDSSGKAFELFDQLRENVGMFKIGSQLFTAAGPDLVRRIIGRGGRVFLDLKFHDIPNTVAAAAMEATRLGVSIFNVHASGGSEMMKRTAASVREVTEHEGLLKPKVIAVTVLTSLADDDLNEIGFAGSLQPTVLKLAQLAEDCGLDGVVASPREIQIVRQRVGAGNFLIVTPGIRAERRPEDDQRRVMTAADAIRAGADYIVVGRPILSVPDPLEAAESIVEQIRAVLSLAATPAV